MHVESRVPGEMSGLGSTFDRSSAGSVREATRAGTPGPCERVHRACDHSSMTSQTGLRVLRVLVRPSLGHVVPSEQPRASHCTINININCVIVSMATHLHGNVTHECMKVT